MHYGNIPIVSPFSLVLAPGTEWYFLGAMVLFIIAIHIHAINRD
jgi:hypothetical protein